MLNQEEYKKKSGDIDSVIRSFYSNKYIISSGSNLVSDVFNLPRYNTLGGSTNYYGQDPKTIFTNVNTPFIRYEFTENINSLSGSVDIIHKIYKLDYDTYKKYNPDFKKKLTDGAVSNDVITKKETILDKNGIISSEKTTISETKISGQTEVFQKEDLVTFEQIQEKLQNEFLIDSFKASGITTPIYDYIPGQFVKSTGKTASGFKQELFEDKGQYFIATSFMFYPKVPEYYTDGEILMGNNASSQEEIEANGTIITGDINNIERAYSSFNPDRLIGTLKIGFPEYEHYETQIESHSITSTTFQNIVVKGNFFTYFKTPNKPIFEGTIVSGTINTFSPKIYYSNVRDGDSSVVEVVYDVNDTGFTSEKYIFKIEKTLDSNGIQEATFPIKTNQNFRYRVGNVKSIKNIFDVEQKITTYSEQFTGKTLTAPEVLVVFSENDSTTTTTVDTPFTPPSLTVETPGNYSLSGNVSGSIVSGATLELIYQNDSSIVINTDLVGDFIFTGLKSGVYTLITTYRGYETHQQILTINKNTTMNYCLEILWSNEFETWGTKDGDIINY